MPSDPSSPTELSCVKRDPAGKVGLSGRALAGSGYPKKSNEAVHTKPSMGMGDVRSQGPGGTFDHLKLRQMGSEGERDWCLLVRGLLV